MFLVFYWKKKKGGEMWKISLKAQTYKRTHVVRRDDVGCSEVGVGASPVC